MNLVNLWLLIQVDLFFFFSSFSHGIAPDIQEMSKVLITALDRQYTVYYQQGRQDGQTKQLFRAP